MVLRGFRVAEADSGEVPLIEEHVVRVGLDLRCVVLEVPVALGEFGALTPAVTKPVDVIHDVGRVLGVQDLQADRMVLVVLVASAGEEKQVGPNQDLVMVVRDFVVRNQIPNLGVRGDPTVFDDLKDLVRASVDRMVQEVAGALVVRKMSEINEDRVRDVLVRMKIVGNVRNVGSIPSHLTSRKIKYPPV